MTSVQTELRSTRLCAEPNTESHPANTPHGQSSSIPPPEVLARLGGRFAADVVDILQKLPEKQTQQKPSNTQEKTIHNEVYVHQAFALARLRGKNVSGAIDYIERHVPNLRQWLDGQIQRFYPIFRVQKSFSKQFAEDVQRIQRFATLVPDGSLVDPEAGRIARIIGQFGIYRA